MWYVFVVVFFVAAASAQPVGRCCCVEPGYTGTFCLSISNVSCQACPAPSVPNWSPNATTCGATGYCCLDGAVRSGVDVECCPQIGGLLGTTCCGNGIVDPGEECDGQTFCDTGCNIIPSGTSLITSTGACCVDLNQDGTWGDLCVDAETPSECYRRKADPVHVLWHSALTCDFLNNCSSVGAANTTGTCCLLDGFDRTADDNLTLGECTTGAFQPGIAANESACIGCISNDVCVMSGCAETHCDADTLLCECVVAPPPAAPVESSTTGLSKLVILLITSVVVLTVVCLVALGLAVASGQQLAETRRLGLDREETTDDTMPEWVTQTAVVATAKKPKTRRIRRQRLAKQM